jgi:hypothetical protein
MRKSGDDMHQRGVYRNIYAVNGSATGNVVQVISGGLIAADRGRETGMGQGDFVDLNGGDVRDAGGVEPVPPI